MCRWVRGHERFDEQEYLHVVCVSFESCVMNTAVIHEMSDTAKTACGQAEDFKNGPGVHDFISTEGNKK